MDCNVAGTTAPNKGALSNEYAIKKGKIVLYVYKSLFLKHKNTLTSDGTVLSAYKLAHKYRVVKHHTSRQMRMRSSTAGSSPVLVTSWAGLHQQGWIVHPYWRSPAQDETCTEEEPDVDDGCLDVWCLITLYF